MYARRERTGNLPSQRLNVRNLKPPEKVAHQKPMNKTQTTPQQFVKRYKTLLSKYSRMEEEQALLREEIETFNQKLIEREGEIDQLRQQVDDVFTFLEHMQQEEQRLPLFEARSAVRDRFLKQSLPAAEQLNLEVESVPVRQDMLALNVWLATHNRFVNKIIGDYMRQRDRVLVIKDYEFLKHLITIGILPDIIITGAYDFGIDDPGHQAFFEFLDRVLPTMRRNSLLHEFYVITLSSTVPVQQCVITDHAGHVVRHEFISKLKGLQITVSEVRFFLEMRRCQRDIMRAEMALTLDYLEEVMPVILEIQHERKTGLLVVLSNDDPTSARWAFHLFFLKGSLVKAEHTLESSVLLPASDQETLLENIFVLSSIDTGFHLNPPKHLYFFTCHQHTILRELRQK